MRRKMSNQKSYLLHAHLTIDLTSLCFICVRTLLESDEFSLKCHVFLISEQVCYFCIND
jgi:hypothetical protein